MLKNQKTLAPTANRAPSQDATYTLWPSEAVMWYALNTWLKVATKLEKRAIDVIAAATVSVAAILGPIVSHETVNAEKTQLTPEKNVVAKLPHRLKIAEIPTNSSRTVVTAAKR
jgi:hypothetical protein